jgi:hypothetical protein
LLLVWMCEMLALSSCHQVACEAVTSKQRQA